MKLLDDFYPTPEHLIRKMISKVKDRNSINSVLEPSAGKGDILDHIKDINQYSRSMENLSAIEINPTLQATLKGKGYKLIDSDFLSYNGGEQFDLVIANFPFSNGEHHLLKAIDIMFSGEIVCLLNAETIKNPYSNFRSDLCKKLDNLNADIEYIQDAFLDAERKTPVEVALIYINMKRDVETELFEHMENDSEDEILLNESNGLKEKDSIESLVREFNLTKDNVTRSILDFYERRHLVGNYLDISIKGSGTSDEASLTLKVKKDINNFLGQLKKDFWTRVTQLEGVKERLTTKKNDELRSEVSKYLHMNFTENNIRQFVINIIEIFPKMIDEAVSDLFDKFTSYGLRESNWGAEYASNIHYFNGWKANDCFKINKKVIIPISYGYAWKETVIKIDYNHRDILNDIDRVISYFTDEKIEKYAFEICEEAVNSGQTRKIETKHLNFTFYKKGTMHIEFTNPEILRLFNIQGAKGKNFLPEDYSFKDFEDLTTEDKELVKKFEGKKNYAKIHKGIEICNKFTLNESMLITRTSAKKDNK